MQDILDLNTELTKTTFLKKQLYNKYHISVDLYGNFDNFFIIAEKNNISEQQVESYLKNANDEIAFLYCSSLMIRSARENEKYQKYFPLMLNKLVGNVQYLYKCLFDANYWYLTARVLYYTNNYYDPTQLEKHIHLFLLEPHLESIFNKCGYELYKKCKRGYNKMLTFFILFQEYFTNEMIATFIQAMYKKINKGSSYKNSISEYLSSKYIRISINDMRWNALKFLIKL